MWSDLVCRIRSMVHLALWPEYFVRTSPRRNDIGLNAVKCSAGQQRLRTRWRLSPGRLDIAQAAVR